MKKMKNRSGAARVAVVCMLTAAVGFSGGCRKQNEGAGKRPPQAVTVQAPMQKDVTIYLKYPGQVRAKEIINIEARVRGYLESVDFIDGGKVKKGDKLFTIESALYEAAVKKAEADVAKAKAQLKVMQSSLDRMQNAYKTKAVSEIDVLVAEGSMESAKADLMAAKAQLASAELDLSYTVITAPVSGRMSRHFESVGNLVGANSPTELARLVTMDPIEVYFNADERTLLRFIKKAHGIRGAVIGGTYPVKMELADGEIYEFDGNVDYVGNQVDVGTGTLPIRAVFPNKKGTLISGLFAKIMIPQEYKDVVLVPLSAIQRDMVGDYLLVVNNEGIVETRYIKTGAIYQSERIVKEGIAVTDRVIIKGLSRVRQGMPVKAEEEPPDTKNQSAGK